MTFANRTEAGRGLAERLEKYAKRDNVIVLGIPRGGVPVAFEIAEALKAPLDVFLLRKLGVPGHEEFAFGAIASGGVRVIDRHTLQTLALTGADVEAVMARERRELGRRETAYRDGRPALRVAGQIAILVDDGVATGASLLAGIHALRQLKPSRIVAAVPVAPPAACKQLAREVDEFVCILAPEEFHAVGEFYTDFSQVSDEAVIEMLARNQRAFVRNAA